MPISKADLPVSRRAFLRTAVGGALVLALAPWRLAAGASGGARDLVVVSNHGGGGSHGGPSVTLIDPGTLDVLATVPLAGAFSFPATRWDPKRDLIWSGFAEAGAVDAFRLSTGKRVAHVPTESNQNYTELTPDGSAVVVAARFRDRLLKVAADPAAADFGSVLARLDQPRGSQPCDVTVRSSGDYAYVPDRGTDTVTTLDVASFEVVSRVRVHRRGGPGPLEPYMATVSPTGNVLFVENAVVAGASQTGSESIFDLTDPERPREVARLSSVDGLGRMPLTSEITPDGRYGMVICRDSDEVSVVDTSTLKVVTNVTFPAGSHPVAGTFLYGDGGSTLFVPLPGRDAVAAVGVPDFRVRKLIPVGPRPVGVVFLEAPLPDRPQARVELGAALAEGRTFPAGCPDPCCGSV
jgi:YVTN family beta-propeller protein